MRKATYLFVVIITFLSFISCSNDSEPASDPAKDKELAEWIKSRVLDDKGEIVFVKNDATEGLYAIPAGSAENAKWFVEDLTRTEWDGQPNTVSLGEEGSVRIAGSEKEGVYNTIEFRIKGVPAFNLDITSWEYLNNDNSYGEIIAICFTKYYLCGNCINISRNFSQGGKCPHCGWSDGLDGDIEVGSLLCTTDYGYAYVVSHDKATEDDVKHCVGFVFYAGQHPKDDTDYYAYNRSSFAERKCHGYAMALYNADYCRWIDPNIFLFKVGTGPEDAWNGYSNTRKMLYNTNWDLKIDNNIFLAAIACKNYKGENRTAPRNSSGWFFPSMAQLQTLGSNYSKIFYSGYKAVFQKSDLRPDQFAERETSYWSSTEETWQTAYMFSPGYEGNKNNNYKDQQAYVRPIIAF